jgi:hypothetical protein
MPLRRRTGAAPCVYASPAAIVPVIAASPATVSCGHGGARLNGRDARPMTLRMTIRLDVDTIIAAPMLAC